MNTPGRLFLTLASGEVVARIAGFVATIILARRLGTSGFGILGLALAVRVYLLIAVEAGIDSIGAREVALDPNGIGRVAPGILVTRLLVALVLIAVTVLGGILLLPFPEDRVVGMVALTLVPVAANFRWVYVGLGRPGGAALARVGAEGLFLLLVVLLVRGEDDLLRIPLYQVAGESLAALGLAVGLRRYFRRAQWRDWASHAAPMYRAAAPMAMHAVLGILIFNADLFFLRGFHDTGTVGVYAAAYMPVSFFVNLAVTFYFSMLPGLAQASANHSSFLSVYQQGIRQVVSLGLPVAAGGALLAGPLLITLFGPEYGSGAVALSLLFLSLPFAFVRSVGQAALVATGHQTLILRSTLAAVGMSMLLNLLLIPGFGMSGAAIATVMTEVVWTTLVVRHAIRMGFLPCLRVALGRPLAAIVVMIAALVLGPRSLVVAVPIGIISYVITMALSGGFRGVLDGPLLVHDPSRGG